LSSPIAAVPPIELANSIGASKANSIELFQMGGISPGRITMSSPPYYYQCLYRRYCFNFWGFYYILAFLVFTVTLSLMSLSTTFGILCGLSIVATFIPLAWHIRNRNTSAICLIVWTTLFNILSLINVLIWGKPNIFTAWDGKIFCDIEIKLFIAAGAGVVGSTASISRNLAKVMSDKISVVKTKAVRRRELAKDLIMCLGLPVWMMATHYIVQPSRYYLLATTGCTPTVDNSWPAVVLLFVWPPLLALVSAFYAGESPCFASHRISLTLKFTDEILW
jgi:hypothetical protein